MKRKVKWPIQQLISRKKKKILRRCSRQVESLDEEEERSDKYLKDYQEGRKEIRFPGGQGGDETD